MDKEILSALLGAVKGIDKAICCMECSNNKVVWINNFFEELVGFNNIPNRGQTLNDFIHPGDKQLFENFLIAALNKTSGFIDVEIRFLNHRNQTVYFIGKMNALYNSKNERYAFLIGDLFHMTFENTDLRIENPNLVFSTFKSYYDIYKNSINSNKQKATGIFDVKAIGRKHREIGDIALKNWKHAQLLEKAATSILIISSDRRILWFNESFLKLTGHNYEDVNGADFATLLLSSETSQDYVETVTSALNRKESTRLEVSIRNKQEKILHIELKLEPYFDVKDTDSFIGTINDITRQKNDDAELKKLNEAIKEYKYIITHQLRHEFSKVNMLLQASKSLQHSVEEFRAIMENFESTLSNIGEMLSAVDSGFREDLPETSGEKKGEEIKEICLIDDDQIANILHKQIFKVMMPKTPVRVFEDVDSSLKYLKLQPTDERLIFLDLSFASTRTGWDFLHDYQEANLSAPVVILSSACETADFNKSKKYKTVLDFVVKPLTGEAINRYVFKA